MANTDPFLPTLKWPRCWRFSPWWRPDPLWLKQRSLLRILSAAAEANLEAAPLVEGLAEDHRGRYRCVLRRLADRLASGLSLADALEQTPGALPEENVLAVRFGIQSGMLAESLTSSLKAHDNRMVQLRGQLARQSGYLGGYLLAGMLVVAFLLISIIPSFRNIQDDFDAHEPLALQWLIAVGEVFANYWFFPFLGISLLVWTLWARWPKRILRRTVSTRWFRSFFEWRSADLLRLLAVASEAGRPLAGALSTLARYHYDRPFRQKLLFVRNEVEQGADPWSSMVDARILSRPEAEAIQTAPDPPSRNWTIGALAREKQNRVTRRLGVLLDLVQPAVILILASGVLLIALAVYQSLVGFIDAAGDYS